MSCEPTERVDPRVLRTRKLLQDSLRAMFHTKPFASISVQDIADGATVNRATFYAHFRDKEDLTISVLRSDLESALRGNFESRPDMNHQNLAIMAESVLEFMRALYEGCPESADAIEPLVGTALQDGVYQVLNGWLEHDPNAMRAFPNTSRETVATVISWSLFGAGVRWSKAKKRRPASVVAEEVVSLLLPVPVAA